MEIALALLVVLALAATLFSVKVMSKNRALESLRDTHREEKKKWRGEKTELDQYRLDRLNMWAKMILQRQEVLRDIQKHRDHPTELEGLGALTFCWSLGIYDRRTLTVPQEAAQAIARHFNLYNGDRSLWQRVIVAIAQREEPPWEEVQDFRATPTTPQRRTTGSVSP